MSEFKKCPQGHYYSTALAQCPFCGKSDLTGTDTISFPTDDSGATVVPTMGPTVGPSDTNDPTGSHQHPPISPGPGTVFPCFTCQRFPNTGGKPCPDCVDFGGRVNIDNTPRRRFVGWLVSYTLDKMGVDFKIYEGRNIIGRDQDCSITVNDRAMTGKHAVLLFKSDKYFIKDELSANGTFVNDKDIEIESCVLKDGDVIRMGNTTFKFKSSL